MAKTAGYTWNGTSRTWTKNGGNDQGGSYEERLDKQLSGLKGDYVQSMVDHYDYRLQELQSDVETYIANDDKIWSDGKGGRVSSLGMNEADEREKAIYGDTYGHTRLKDRILKTYKDLTGESVWLPSRISFGSETQGKVRQHAKKVGEKKFEAIKAKMKDTTIAKGLNPAKARITYVEHGSGELLIQDGRVSLHARWIFATGKIVAPHFRFIVTDRKGD